MGHLVDGFIGVIVVIGGALFAYLLSRLKARPKKEESDGKN